MKKTVLKVDIYGENSKTEVMKTVSKLAGVDMIAVDANRGILTVVGEVDPTVLVNQLRKSRRVVQILSVGPPGDDSDSDLDSNSISRPPPRCYDTYQPVVVNYGGYDGGGPAGCTIL